MSRVAQLVALAMLLSACTTIYVEEPDLAPCDDLTVGDRVEWEGFRVRDADLPEDAIEAEWVLAGPGVLEVGPELAGRPAEERATYAATEPGEATVVARLTEYDVPDLDLPLGISSRARVFERRCTFGVAAAQAPPTTVRAAELVYDVTQLVTRSDTGLGLGSEAQLEWVVRFDCDDGRCDGGVSIGGSPFYDMEYRSASDDFAISLAVDQAGGAACPSAVTTGVVTPTAWDELGPVEFQATRQSVLACDTGDIVTEFADSGRRG